MTESPAVLRTAWIFADDGIYLVRTAGSAVGELIERISHAEAARSEATGEPSRARSFLRRRIFVDREPTFAERETVKVAAKRIEVSDRIPPPPYLPLPDLPPPDSFAVAWRDEPLAPGRPVDRADVPSLLAHLRSFVPREENRDRAAPSVSALLLDASGRLIAHAWNTNLTIRTRHAEWNLCERLAREGRRIDAGTKLYVSLKPCRMCAARICELAEDPARLEVVYFEFDPGPLAQETLLDEASAARRRHWGASHPLYRTSLQKRDG